jgi:spermidine synthase
MLQIALNRIFSFTIWYHFAYISISLALLGFGASGSMLAAFPRLGGQDLARSLGRDCGLAALTTLIALVVIGSVRLDPFEILKSRDELVKCGLYFTVVTLPFFFVGLAITTALREARDAVHRLYFWDLVGAGLGCALVIGAIEWLETPRVVLVVAIVMALAGVVAAGSVATRVRNLNLVLAGVLLVLAGPLPGVLPFTPSRDKHIMLWEQETVHFTRWSSIFRTDMVGGATKELVLGGYGGLGLSPRFEGTTPPYRMIFHDGSAAAIMYQVDGTLTGLDMFRHHILAVPYVITQRPEVLIIGVGGGADVLNALVNGARDVTAVELDPITVRLVTEDFRDYTGRVYERDDVTIHTAEGRHFVRSMDRKFDLVQLSGVDTLAALSSGAYILAENYLYSVEAYRDYLASLRADGILSISGIDFHPRDKVARHSLRFVSLSYDALRGLDVEQPHRHVMVVATKPGGWTLAQVLTKKTMFSQAEITAMESFVDANGFEAWYLPGRPERQQEAFRQLLEGTPDERRRFFADTFLDLRATTDDRPFFFSFYKWRHLFEHRTEIDLGHSLATGQLVLVGLLVAACGLSLLVIIFPLIPARSALTAIPGRWGFMVYFGALGTGFIFLEISFVQRFILFLGYPTYSLSVMLFAFLTSAGVGAHLSGGLPAVPSRVLPQLSTALTGLVLLYVLALPSVFDLLLEMPLSVRILVTVLLCVPLGGVLGMFFPFGLKLVSEMNVNLVPWAWAVNGCLTVVGSVASIVIALTFGFRTVALLAVAIYWVGAVSFMLAYDRVSASKAVVA